MRQLILFATIIATSASVWAYDKQALIQSYFSVVMIRGYNDTGGVAYGSGVVVDSNTVITNCHVLRTTKEPWVSRGEDTYTIKSVKADVWHDLCLVSTETLPFKPVKIGNSTQLQRGQEVAGIGHSNGSPAPLTSTGYIHGLYDDASGKVMRTNAQFRMGASGSGLFDMDGYLVGINTFKTAGRGGSVYFALPVEWIETLKKQPALTTFPISGKALWEEDEDKKPFYMQAAVPESRQDWPKLAMVSKKWINAKPNSADAWFALALSQEKLGDLDAASKYYQQSAKLDPNYMDVFFKIGDIAKLQNDEETLAQVFIDLSKINPEISQKYQQHLNCTATC